MLYIRIYYYGCYYHGMHTMWCPSLLAKLVNIIAITIFSKIYTIYSYTVDISIFTWGFKPTYNWGGTTLYGNMTSILFGIQFVYFWG